MTLTLLDFEPVEGYIYVKAVEREAMTTEGFVSPNRGKKEVYYEVVKVAQKYQSVIIVDLSKGEISEERMNEALESMKHSGANEVCKMPLSFNIGDFITTVRPPDFKTFDNADYGSIHIDDIDGIYKKNDNEKEKKYCAYGCENIFECRESAKCKGGSRQCPRTSADAYHRYAPNFDQYGNAVSAKIRDQADYL